MDCYMSSEPAAMNATLLFDFNNNQENLWIRGSQDVPLPPCSSTAPGLDSNCTVCIEHVVSILCRKLMASVQLIMEAGEGAVQIVKSECPEVPPPSAGAPQWKLLTAITLLLIVILSVVVGYVGYRKCPRKATVRESGPVLLSQ